MDVVIVESPAKAKTINKYLGNGYRVLASYGHVRDLPAKEGSVLPDADFAMTWQVDARAEKQLGEIAKALKGAKTIYLATDPDREGEAISWHIEEILRQRDLLDAIEVKRVVFNQVTAKAVREAFAHPRRVDDDLVEAYLARRALDYLVGFTLSPVLWRKLPGARSAGRVQSVALRLVCEREAEIEAFKTREYWTVEMQAASARGEAFSARLTHLDGGKLDKFTLPDADAAAHARAAVESREFTVARVERKRTKRNPYPPFITSTLQQEASRKLGFSATKTMRVAQRLYEGVDLGGETVGLITYMRTDSVVLSGEAIAACRDMIGRSFGPDYLPETPRVYKTKAKNAQEAHEAIRPADLFSDPREVRTYLAADEFRLYDLIWKRTMASEMASAEIDQIAADLASPDGRVCLRATGSTVAFDGFLKLYREDRDDADGDGDANRRLPELNEGEAVRRTGVAADQHFTQPPPRYTEASLVKTMEEVGIGRPSTYASILQVLQTRDYVRLEKRRFIPEDRGRIVTAFLTNFFRRYVEYDFTAKLEEQLDDISGGRIGWKEVLRTFWSSFFAAVEETSELTGQAVREALDEALSEHFFPPPAEGGDRRLCPGCEEGRLALKFGRHGAFIGCSAYPECRYTRALKVADGEDTGAALAAGPLMIGHDPESGSEVTLRRGPYGLYLQVGEPEGKVKPKRAGVPEGWGPDELDLRTALGLLALPREVGPHPQDGKPIEAGIGRYGPYLRHGGIYARLEDPRDALSIGLNHAVTIIAEKGKSRRGASNALREFGAHPEDGKPVRLYDGRYGPYVKHGRVNATLPKDMDVDSLTLDDAVALIAAKSARRKTPAKPSRRKGAANSSRRKSAAKKSGGEAKPKRTAKPRGRATASAD
ncbi:MAG: type I DNA topoisomerase [Alphaproteobacteria bacterium]